MVARRVDAAYPFFTRKYQNDFLFSWTIRSAIILADPSRQIIGCGLEKSGALRIAGPPRVYFYSKSGIIIIRKDCVSDTLDLDLGALWRIQDMIADKMELPDPVIGRQL